jgi:pimeloyl-ACP methyl ester carboxylesterase
MSSNTNIQGPTPETYWNEDHHFWAQYFGPLDPFLSRYNDSEHIAWNSAAALKDFVNHLPGSRKHIAAHSMGNIVASEAIRLGMRVDNYALMQAAVPSACYDDDERTRHTEPESIKFELLNINLQVYNFWNKQTPDDDPDLETRKLAYRGRFKNIGQNTNLTSFFLPGDYATFIPWQVNNDLTKPEGILATSFAYERNNPSGEKLFKYHTEVDSHGGIPFDVKVVDYYLENSYYEAMAYACSTWGKALGAQNVARGSIDNEVNLSELRFALPGETDPGFGDEHSGQFNANIQYLKAFYDRLLEAFDLQGVP